MLTQCPNCQTTFRVTSEILRVAAGQVRCGRCQTQFDALARLLDEDDDGAVQSGRFLRPGRAQSSPPPATDIDVEEPDVQEDITLEGRHIEISGVYRSLDENGEPHEEAREEIIAGWPEDEEPEVETRAEDEVIEIPEPEADLDELASELASSQTSSASTQPVAAQAATEETSAEFDLLHSTAQPTASRWWTVGAPLLALLLALQVVHHYRTTLARHPGIGEPISKAYRAVGLPITPDWDLHAYEIRQWGVISEPSQPGALRVRASVTNMAPFAQPYPLLRLVLEDRWGDQVRARAFTPAEYLDPAASPDRMLAPAQQANATLVIVDPGTDAESFRFDVCLPARDGEVCAEDLPQA